MQRMMKLGLVVGLFLAVGCAPTLKVQVLQPASVNFGSAKRLSVVQSEGRRSARELVIGELLTQARGGGYFQPSDRSEEGITLKVAGRTATATGGKAAQEPDEVFVRIDVQDWNASKESKTTKDSKGNETTTTVYKGSVVLGVTASNAKGQALLAEKEYASKLEADDETKALNNSAKDAVARILADITPKLVTKEIRLDNDDEKQKPIIETARNGNIAQAMDEMRKYLEAAGNNPSAQYNLAVMLDASGQYKEALDFYNKATAGSTKDYYVAMKTECAKRLADQEALSQ